MNPWRDETPGLCFENALQVFGIKRGVSTVFRVKK